MKRVFHDFGAMIVTVIAVVALIGLTVFLMRPGSVMANAFSAITGQFVDAADEMIGGAGNGEESKDVAATPYNQVYYAQGDGALWEVRFIELNGSLTAIFFLDGVDDSGSACTFDGQNVIVNGAVRGTFSDDFKSLTWTFTDDGSSITFAGELAEIKMETVYSGYMDGALVSGMFYADGSGVLSGGGTTDAVPAGYCKYDNGILSMLNDDGTYDFSGLALSGGRLWFAGIVFEVGGELPDDGTDSGDIDLSQMECIVEEQSLAFSYSAFGSYVCEVSDLLPDTPTIGETYVVVWDGVPYACIVKENAVGTIGAHFVEVPLYVGDATLVVSATLAEVSWNVESTGEPFGICFAEGSNNYDCTIFTQDTAATHTVSVYH